MGLIDNSQEEVIVIFYFCGIWISMRETWGKLQVGGVKVATSGDRTLAASL